MDLTSCMTVSMGIQHFHLIGGDRPIHLQGSTCLPFSSLAYLSSQWYEPFIISSCVCTLPSIYTIGCSNRSFVHRCSSMIEIQLVRFSSLRILLNQYFYKCCFIPGRVLNRFAKDIGCMDEMLPSAFFDVITV